MSELLALPAISSAYSIHPPVLSFPTQRATVLDNAMNSLERALLLAVCFRITTTGYDVLRYVKSGEKQPRHHKWHQAKVALMKRYLLRRQGRGGVRLTEAGEATLEACEVLLGEKIAKFAPRSAE